MQGRNTRRPLALVFAFWKETIHRSDATMPQIADVAGGSNAIVNVD
jgi:hypothetical protein